MQLTESLHAGDLEYLIKKVFGIDAFKSKIGDDEQVAVLSFEVKQEDAAKDLENFIEMGYSFVLDADCTAGETDDGSYFVFVELERSSSAAKQMKEIIGGISQLCDNYEWKFRFHKDYHSKDFSEEAVLEEVPLTPEDYESKLLEFQNADVNEFFDQGAIDNVVVDQDDNITFEKPYSESFTAKLVDIGDYETVKDNLPGGISLDESSRGQTLYLEKYLGNYEIHKINEHFLIRNGNRAIVLKKENW